MEAGSRIPPMQQRDFSRRDLLMMAGAGEIARRFPGIYLPTRPPLSPDQPHQLSPEEERLKRHAEHHYPRAEGKEVPAVAYLSLPFREADLPKTPDGKPDYDITEGWLYSPEEKAIHEFSDVHGGVDIHVPFGTPVIAPYSGYAMATYHNFIIENPDHTPRLYEGKPVGFGLGYFVQMIVEIPPEGEPDDTTEYRRYIQLAHLRTIALEIPFYMPKKSGTDFNPTHHNESIQTSLNHPLVVWVEKGQKIGEVGTSGLTWGYTEYEDGAKRPIPLDENLSWDKPHVHLEDHWRKQSGENAGAKESQRDPYGIYDTNLYYPTPNRRGIQGVDPLFLLDQNGLPRFAA